ncbi:MAG: hypothetical protein JXQ82_01885 [Methanomicrobiaceae archaeon]|nr:hypothetical protein [Methanomicrobiaceae archaeon]
MREEDIDWKIYHIIVAKKKCQISDIIKTSGIENKSVLKSLKRLEKNCLIETYKDSVRILSLQETILRNSISSAVNDANSKIIIENGIVKENPGYKENF